MSEQEVDLELSRTDVMWMLHIEGRRFVDMIPPLVQLGLLECKESHRKRPARNGEVCETCENVLNSTWSRYLTRLGATKEDADQVRGKWLHAHETIAEICMKRYEQDVEVTTTTESGEGEKRVVTTTTRREKKIHVALLRLYLEARDKVARIGGLNVDKFVPRKQIPRKILSVFEADPHGDDRVDA